MTKKNTILIILPKCEKYFVQVLYSVYINNCIQFSNSLFRPFVVLLAQWIL